MLPSYQEQKYDSNETFSFQDKVWKLCSFCVIKNVWKLETPSSAAGILHVCVCGGGGSAYERERVTIGRGETFRTPTSNMGYPRFDSRPDGRLSRLAFFVDFLCPFRQMLRWIDAIQSLFRQSLNNQLKKIRWYLEIGHNHFTLIYSKLTIFNTPFGTT
jgi:hypothetical protein